MDCAEFREGLFGESGFRGGLRLAAHTWSCGRCREEARRARRIEGALASLEPHEPPEGLRGRLVALAAGEGALRPGQAGRRWRALRWGVAAVAVLTLAAGVLVTRGERQSALAQALDGLRNAKTIHFVAWADVPDTPRRLEFWIAGEQRFRQEETWTLKGVSQKEFTVQVGRRVSVYREPSKTLEIDERPAGSALHDLGQLPLHPEVLGAAVAEDIRGRGGSFREQAGVDSSGRPVVRYYASDLSDTPTSFVFTLDARTKRLIALEASEYRDGKWYRVGHFDPIEYDIPLPDDLFAIAPPPGTRVTERTWWATRRDRVLQEAAVGEWQIAIRSLDIRDNGDVIVSLSRKLLAGGSWNEGAPPWGRLTDDQGQRYAEMPVFGVDNGFWTLTFTPVDRRTNLHPTSITVELNPYPPGSDGPGHSRPDPGVLVFDDLPATYLPPGDPFSQGEAVDDDDVARTEAERQAAISAYHRRYAD
jgi:hypothetical protein